MKRMYYSFRAAVNGIAYVARHETNFRIHLVFVLLVISGGCLFSISSMNWMMLFLSMAFVLCAEIFNTSIEVLCNKVQPAQDPLIRIIKDVAAALGDKAKVIRIDVDKNQELAEVLRIKGLPTLMIYKEGVMMWRQSGELDANTIIGLVQEQI